jgi:hypothetical protein
MLRLLTIFAMFLVGGTSPVQAQHQEADLERVAIPGAGFDLVVAIPKSDNIILRPRRDARRTCDPATWRHTDIGI